MAKVSKVQREQKIDKLVAKYWNKRVALKKIISDRDISSDKKLQAQFQLDALPRNSLKIRRRSRCSITGNPRGYRRRFGLCRDKIREYASQGMLAGVIKSSW